MRVEIFDGIVPQRGKMKYAAINQEILELLLKVPNGKSVRAEHSSKKDALGQAQSIKTVIKMKGLSSSYFVSVPKDAVDGKFYVYVGHKQ